MRTCISYWMTCFFCNLEGKRLISLMRKFLAIFSSFLFYCILDWFLDLKAITLMRKVVSDHFQVSQGLDECCWMNTVENFSHFFGVIHKLMNSKKNISCCFPFYICINFKDCYLINNDKRCLLRLYLHFQPFDNFEKIVGCTYDET